MILAGEAIRQKGHVPFIPLMNVVWELALDVSEEAMMEWDLHWLRKCDAIIRLPGESVGADYEIEKAKEWGLTIYDRLEDVPSCLSESFGINRQQ
jgi:hypothetical protein